MKLFKKLNQKGFSHHLLIPIVVVLVIAGIGSYLLFHSHAEELPSSVANPSTMVPCSPTMNSFQGSGYVLHRDSSGANHYTSNNQPDHEIVFQCGAGGFGVVWYRNFKTGSKVPISTTAGDIGMHTLPDHGVSIVIVGGHETPDAGYLTVLNFDFHGQMIGDARVGSQPACIQPHAQIYATGVPYPAHVTGFNITKVAQTGPAVSDGSLQIHTDATITMSNGGYSFNCW